MSNEHRRWQSLSLEARYAQLHGKRPAAEPAAAAASLPRITLSAEELEEHARNGRRARAMMEIERAQRAEREAAVQERRNEVDRIMRGSTLGQFVTGGLR